MELLREALPISTLIHQMMETKFISRDGKYIVLLVLITIFKSLVVGVALCLSWVIANG